MSHADTLQSNDADQAVADPATVQYDISGETIIKAARLRFGPGADVSGPFWVDTEIVRVSIGLERGNISFGANFYYKEGRFR